MPIIKSETSYSIQVMETPCIMRKVVTRSWYDDFFTSLDDGQ